MGYDEAIVMRRGKGATVGEVWMEGGSYEEWTSTGRPYNSDIGQTYNVEIMPNGKAVWREVAKPELPVKVGGFQILGSMTQWDLESFEDSAATEGLFTYEFTLGSSGEYLPDRCGPRPR